MNKHDNNFFDFTRETFYGMGRGAILMLGRDILRRENSVINHGNSTSPRSCVMKLKRILRSCIFSPLKAGLVTVMVLVLLCSGSLWVASGDISCFQGRYVT